MRVVFAVTRGVRGLYRGVGGGLTCLRKQSPNRFLPRELQSNMRFKGNDGYLYVPIESILLNLTLLMFFFRTSHLVICFTSDTRVPSLQKDAFAAICDQRLSFAYFIPVFFPSRLPLYLS